MKKPVEMVQFTCERCGRSSWRGVVQLRRLRQNFGEAWCVDCQEVVRVWLRRGGERVDLPVGAELVVVYNGVPLGPLLP